MACCREGPNRGGLRLLQGAGGVIAQVAPGLRGQAEVGEGVHKREVYGPGFCAAYIPELRGPNAQ